MRSASSASMMRPVSISSQAREAPISRGSSQLTPMSHPEMPSRTKATLKRADAAGDADVAGQGQGEAPPRRRPVDGGNHGLGQRAQPRDERGDVGLRGEGGLHPPETLRAWRIAVPAEVEPGAEAPARPVRSTTRQEPIGRNGSRPSWSSPISAAFIAFSFLGGST